MNPWIPIVVLSVLAGVISALVFRGNKAVMIGALVPWFGLLAVLLYTEFFVPYQGGGASMWPVAQLYGGAVAALVGGGSARIVQAKWRRS